MQIARILAAIALVGAVSGCYPPAQTQYSPAAFEQPQPVEFFYGTLIDVRPATLEYGYEAGLGVTALPRWPAAAGVHFGAAGPLAAARFSAGVVDVLAEASVPNLPAVEFTVLLDPPGRISPDSDMQPQPRAAIIVVQNQKPGDPVLRQDQRVFVRVVGETGHVFAASDLPPWAEPLIKASAPMPVPLADRPAPPAPVPACPLGAPMYWGQRASDVDIVAGALVPICDPYYERVSFSVE